MDNRKVEYFNDLTGTWELFTTRENFATAEDLVEAAIKSGYNRRDIRIVE